MLNGVRWGLNQVAGDRHANAHKRRPRQLGLLRPRVVQRPGWPRRNRRRSPGSASYRSHQRRSRRVPSSCSTTSRRNSRQPRAAPGAPARPTTPAARSPARAGAATSLAPLGAWRCDGVRWNLHGAEVAHPPASPPSHGLDLPCAARSAPRPRAPRQQLRSAARSIPRPTPPMTVDAACRRHITCASDARRRTRHTLVAHATHFVPRHAPARRGPPPEHAHRRNGPAPALAPGRLGLPLHTEEVVAQVNHRTAPARSSPP